MKKFLITLVLCLFSLSVFSSCSFLSDKMGVMERISRAMDKVDSYESVGELSITAYYDNKKMYIKGDTKQIFSKEKDSGLYFYCSDTVDIEYNSTNTSTTVVEAYNDGEYFFSHTLNNVGNKLRSSHTEEEFLEYYEKVSESGDLLSGYSELTSVKNDDGKYEISLSEYNGEKIRDINLIYGFPLDDGGASIENINVSILANAEYLVEEINVEYVFSDALYSGEQKVVFSNYGSAEKKMSVVNPKIYTAVEDARAVPLLSSLLNDKKQADKGKFNSSSDVESTFMGSHNESNETYIVSYGYDDGEFEYDIELKQGDESHSIQYKDGVYIRDGQKNKDYTEYAAKAFVVRLIDPYSYSPSSVSQVSVKHNDDGTDVYTLEVNPENTAIESMIKGTFSSANASYLNSTVKITFEVEDEKLTSITYKIEATGQIRYNSYNYMELGIDIKTKIVFK